MYLVCACIFLSVFYIVKSLVTLFIPTLVLESMQITENQDSVSG